MIWVCLLIFFPGPLPTTARKRYPDHGTTQLLLPVLPPPRDPAHLHLPAHDLPHPGGLRQVPGPRAHGGNDNLFLLYIFTGLYFHTMITPGAILGYQRRDRPVNIPRSSTGG